MIDTQGQVAKCPAQARGDHLKLRRPVFLIRDDFDHGFFRLRHFPTFSTGSSRMADYTSTLRIRRPHLPARGGGPVFGGQIDEIDCRVFHFRIHASICQLLSKAALEFCVALAVAERVFK